MMIILLNPLRYKKSRISNIEATIASKKSKIDTIVL